MKKRSIVFLLCLSLLTGLLVMLSGEAKAVATGETTIVSEPETGVAYKFRLDQKTTDKILFFTGETDSYSNRLASTSYFSGAVDVYLEQATGGYRLYFMYGSTKTYIRVYEYQDGNAGYGKGTLQLTTSVPSEVFTWDSTYKTLVYRADADNSYYIGTYKSYENFSVSNTSYLKTSNVDISQFPARLAIAEELEDLPDVSLIIDHYPDMDKPYYLQMKQLRVGKHLFFDGSADYSTGTARLNTVDSMSAAVNVYAETANGGFYLYFMNGDTKTYIRVYESVDGESGAGQGSLELVTTAPSEALQWDSNYNTLVYPADEYNYYYLGANGTDSTIGVCNLYALNSSNADVTQYPVHLSVSGGIESGLKYTVKDGEATIVGREFNGMNEVVIPETIGGYPVRTIAKEAFYCDSYISSVTIPSGITYIGEAAFGFCGDLTSVHISDMNAWLNIEFESFESNPLCCAEKLYLDGNLVTSVVVPQGTTAIKDYAFLYCTSLTSVTIPESVTVIGQNAFNSTGLTTLTLPSGLTTIGSRAFEGCADLTAVTIPENVTDIGYEAFEGCAGLTEIRFNAVNMNDQTENSRIFSYAGKANGGVAVTVGAKVQKIPAYLFEPYYSDMVYVTSVTFEEGSVCTTIGDYAFYRCQKLTAITLPDSVTEIGQSAFSSCIALKSITWGSNITQIGSYAFSGCKALTAVEIPNTVTELGDGVFSSCSGLTEVKLGNKLETIGGHAFYNCAKLTELSIPASVTFIGEEAFNDCSALTKVFIGDGGWATDICTNENAVHVSSLAALAKINFGSYDANPLYKLRNLCVNGELVTELVIPEDVASIGNYAFSGLDTATSVSIPASVKAVGEGAFFDCNGVESIYITNLGAWCEFDSSPMQYAYNGKLYLNGEIISGNIVIPEGTTAIGPFAFRGCDQITSVTIPDSVTKIGEYAFSGCRAMENVTIGEGVAVIEESAFEYCSALKSVTIPDSVTEIGSYAFGDCDGITELSLGNGVTRIGNSAFSSCDYLTSIVIPDSTTHIGDYAFACGRLKTVTFGTRVRKVGTDAFNCQYIESVYIKDLEAWCKIDFSIVEGNGYKASSNPLSEGADLYLNGELVTEVFFPEGLTRGEAMVFSGCTSLEAVVIPEGAVYIGSYAFQNCPNLTAVSIPESVTYLDGSAFYGTDALEHVAFGGTQEQWNALVTSSTVTVDVSNASFIHFGTQLTSKETCSIYGLYCSACDKMLTSHTLGTGSHTYTDETDITCNVCGYEQSVERITIYAYPFVLEYPYHETAPEVDPLDVTGGVVCVYYNDGAIVNVDMTNDMVTGLDVCQPGDQTLTVTYAGKTTEYYVSVVQEVEPVRLPLMLLINKLPAVRSYAVGDELNLEGFVLDAFYEDGVEQIPWWWASYSGVDMSTPGKKRVEVEYEGLTTAFDIWVHEYTYTELDSSYYPEPEVFEGPQAFYIFSAEDAGQTNVNRITITFDDNCNYDQGVYTAIYDYDGHFITVFDGDLSNAEVVVSSEGFFINIYSDIGDLTQGIGFASIQLGKPTHTYTNGECFCGAGQSAIGGFVTDTTGGIISGTHTGFDNLGSALGSDAASDWLKLYTDVEDADLSLTSDLYIDLNGHAFMGQIVTNGYKIYCMDSATDEYRCDNMGYMYCWDENGAAIAPERYFKTDITGTVKRYLLIEDEYEPGMYTSHRFYLGITHQTLKPGTHGVGYKAVFYGDEMVVAQLNSEQAFGFTMNLEGMDSVRFYKSRDRFISGKTVTLRVDNFDVENYGETNLYASVMIKLADGTVIESAQHVMTLRSFMENLNELHTALSNKQLSAVAEFIKKYAIIQSWKVENLI